MDLDGDALYRALQTRDARFDGQLFTGVKTTGVYCRPICPARTPKRENVRFFPSAAAAQEAGFRPCLRCRPETSPDLGAWRGASNTVQRALTLIEAGALDAADVEQLASRLGMGERQLRRLFRQHLGASPIAVAQTRRVLLAKQLIHETRLPMVEVALASGFSSVRRFNETFQQLYDRPPNALRRLSGAEQPAAGAVTLKLTYRPPYDWTAMLDFLRLRAIPGVESVEDGVYARVIALGGARGVLSVQPAPDARLNVTVRFPKLAALPAIIARVRRVFDLAADPEKISAHLARDPVLKPLVAARPGLRVPGAWDGFELGVRAILGQQISVRAAAVLAGGLAAAYGARLDEPVPGLPSLTHAFPAPETLAAADLSELPMPKARSAAIAGLAAAAAADPDLFAPRAGLDEAVVKLRRLPGVGEWTAQYIAMRQLREPDAFPAADLGLLRAMAGPDGERPSAAALLAHAERWRPWRAYAAQHLWASEAPPHKSAKEKPMPIAPPPEGLAFDRLPTPAGEALMMWDAQGRLRVFDWDGYEPRMRRLLERHYGPVDPRGDRVPKGLREALTAYFDGELSRLDTIECATGGTAFQRQIWAALREIPAGQTESYGALAARIGRPAAVRAVGLANGANPIGLVVPCHRVIGANGALTGYGGGIERKRWLLQHEGAAFRQAA